MGETLAHEDGKHRSLPQMAVVITKLRRPQRRAVGNGTRSTDLYCLMLYLWVFTARLTRTSPCGPSSCKQEARACGDRARRYVPSSWEVSHARKALARHAIPPRVAGKPSSSRSDRPTYYNVPPPPGIYRTLPSPVAAGVASCEAAAAGHDGPAHQPPTDAATT